MTGAPAPRRRRASREGRRRRPSRPRGRRPKHTTAPPRAHHAFAAHRAALRRYGDGREQPQERGARRLDRLHLPGGAGAQQRRPGLGHRDPTAPAAQTEALAIFLAAEPTDGAAPAAPKKPLALKPLLTPKSKRIATKAMPKFKAKADAAEHETKEALEDDEHPWWYMTAR